MRYVIISDDMTDATINNVDQRFVSLNREDAINNSTILNLRTLSELRRYEEKQKAPLNPVEDILYNLIRDNYKDAEEHLQRDWNKLPEYLRLVLKADLTYERQENGVDKGQIVKMYQAAFDVQTSEFSRNIIRLRIRQLKYGR